MLFFMKNKTKKTSEFVSFQKYIYSLTVKWCVVCDHADCSLKSGGCSLRTEIRQILLCVCIELKHALDYVILEMDTSQSESSR